MGAGIAVGWRHIVAVMSFFALAVNYIVINTMSVTIVSMVNYTARSVSYAMDNVSVEFDADGPCVEDVDNTNSTQPAKEGPFSWTHTEVGLILAAFYYGYITTQVLGGTLAAKYGAKWVFGLGTMFAVVVSFFTPLAATFGYQWLISIRVIEGVAEGFTFPAAQALMAEWVPPLERTKIPTFVNSGCMFGAIMAFSVSGLLAESSFLDGWPLPFYFGGIVGCIWFLLWIVLVSDCPANHRFISAAEKDYITKALLQERQSDPGKAKRVKISEVPWTAILKSLPVWCVFISHFSFNWCFYIMLTTLPQYLKTMLGFKLRSNGVLSALPYIGIIIVLISVSQAADVLRSRYKVKTVYVRKFCDCSGHFLPGAGLLAVGFIGCNRVAAVASLITTVAISGLCGGGFLNNLLDICPPYAGIVMGFSNTLATLGGIIGPYTTAVLTQGPPSFYSWRKVFYIATALYWFATVFYLAFAKGTIQKWAVARPKNKAKVFDKF